MIDIEPLLAPTRTMPPAGIDLEYDAAFLEFEALARGMPARQFDTLAEAPPWGDVLEQATALLERSKDLRIAVVYTRAASHVHGVAGFHAGLRLLMGLFERYWDTLYPPLDADEGNDPALRVNALAPLADPYTPYAEAETLLNDLRESEVCRVHGERLTVRDILVAQGKLAPPEGAGVKTLSRVEGVLADALAQNAALLVEGLDLPRAVQALGACMTDRLGAERTPLLIQMTATAGQIAAQFRAAAPRNAPSPGAGAMPEDSPPAPHRAMARPGELASREDAIALLDAVCAFLERTEPTNPAPLLIRRARGLLGKDFMAVMQDLAPDSLSHIHLIAGTRPQ
ncbi:type VI secretion system protein TssA [Caballeronia sp. TF1N1]|uniref:type VI secretion system protein TssA n=1 Tax=Caballeronia sp. TF1N1 TaxID=2878153 RepID=UPI001FD4BAF9|nr:type VI secretion system protein TssA [Caballeronia sp. TF1N1]